MIKLVGGRSNNLLESETLNASEVSREQHQFVVCVTICESLSDQTKVRVPLERVLDRVLLKRVPGLPAERRRVRRRPRLPHSHSLSIAFVPFCHAKLVGHREDRPRIILLLMLCQWDT